MTLKTRITLISVLTTFLVAAILVIVALITENMTQQRAADAVLTGNRLIWEQLLADQMDRTAEGIAPFENEFELRSAIKQQDREGIREYAERFVNLTGDSGRYDLLQILDAEQQLLYSSNQAMRLDKLATLLDPVVSDRQVQHGILTTSDGTPMVVVAFPVESRRKLKGLALYGKRLDDVVARLAERSGAGIAVSTGGLVAQSGLPEFSDLDALLPAIGEHAVTTARAAEREYVFSAQTISDATGAAIAHLLVARDDTEALREQRSTALLGDAVALLAIIAGMLVLFFSLKRYLAPLQKTAATVARIAKGDLTARVTVDGVAEIAELERAMDNMVVSLRDMVGNIGQVSGMIRSTAASMDECVGLAHQSIGEQNTRSDNISLSLSEMAASVQSESEVTEQAAGTAVAMRDEADQGHALLQRNVGAARQLSAEMDQVGSTLEGLNAHVGLVTEIVNVIKGIAEQTNLLALNAAIEAARAGEQGRGFAVVADEVRALAGRTQHSTTEIEQTIDKLLAGAADSVSRMQAARDHVRDNMDQAQNALQRFAGIKQRIDELVSINQTIAAAVEQQGIVARDVSDNMAGIQQLAQENGQRTDYLASTTHSLNELAGSLASITAQFRYQTDGGDGAQSA
jgi:methyl-accepting chemotaxis protein